MMKKFLSRLVALVACAFLLGSISGCNTSSPLLTADGTYPEYFGGQGSPFQPNDFVPREVRRSDQMKPIY